MTAGEQELISRARDAIADRITEDYPSWVANHDLYGWYAQRLDDGHEVRASGPDGLRALISAAPPFCTWHAAGELRRAYPGWHIWMDAAGYWHARRRGNFRQEYRRGAPLYAVHEADAQSLRERLAEQERQEPTATAG
ncbi:MAG: hypothetical protein ACRDNZ_06985 [Streptosporangiaceae bacterium]